MFCDSNGADAGLAGSRSQLHSARGARQPRQTPPSAHSTPQQASRPGSGGGGEAPSTATGTARVLFSCCKGETHTHRAGYKQLFRRLRSSYRTEKLAAAEDLCPEILLASGGGGATSSQQPAVLVLGGPTQRFSAAECGALTALLSGGGGLLVLLPEGGEAAAGTNVNYLLEQFGIVANPDAVLRTSFHKYMHPKEALVVDGVLNRALLAGADAGKGAASCCGDSEGGGHGCKRSSSGSGGGRGSGGGEDAVKQAQVAGGLHFVYPHGCTLTVQRPAVPLLSSGCICFPMQRPLAAAWEGPPLAGGGRGGRLLVFGSVQLFDDRWLDKEANARLMEWAFKWLRPVRGLQ
jgi:intraflagellar transport protein 52